MREYRGIKKAAGETKYLTGYNGRVQINYDPSDKTVWADYFSDVNSRKLYFDPNIISIFTKHPMTMEEIKSQIKIEIADKKQYEAEMKIEHENQLRYAKEMKKYDYME